MQITKTGTGTYKCPSDLAQIGLTLTLRGLKNDDWNMGKFYFEIEVNGIHIYMVETVINYKI